METSVNNECKAFTSLEQSKKLAEILPLESADMLWGYYYNGKDYVIEEEKKKALPNMPTHYMMIPNCKAQKGE